MSDYPLAPKNYRIENTWWKSQYVSVGGEDIVGYKHLLGGTQTVRPDRVFYLFAADHRPIVEARV